MCNYYAESVRDEITKGADEILKEDAPVTFPSFNYFFILLFVYAREGRLETPARNKTLK